MDPRRHVAPPMEAKNFRIMIIGGLSSWVPRDKILCDFTHLDVDEASSRKAHITFTPGKHPHVLLAFRDKLSHKAGDKFRAAAKTLNIPFVLANGGFGALIAQAEAQGIHLSHVIRSSKAIMIQDAKPEDVVMRNWIHKMPTGAYETNLGGGRKAYVIATSAGTALVLKGDPLEFVLEVMRRNKMGKGKRSNLTASEAREIVKKLEHIYELKKYNVRSPKPPTIINMTDRVLGTGIPDDQKKRRKPGKKKSMVKSLEELQNDSYPDKTPAEPKEDEPEGPPEEPPTPPAPKPPPAPVQPEIQDDPLAKLYERLIVSERENAAFIEQIGHLEEKLKQADVRIKELEEKARRLV